MTTAETIDTIATWDQSDQLELVFEVWDRLLDKGWKPTVTPELEAELQRRLAAYKANPEAVYTWEEVMTHIRRPQ